MSKQNGQIANAGVDEHELAVEKPLTWLQVETRSGMPAGLPFGSQR